MNSLLISSFTLYPGAELPVVCNVSSSRLVQRILFAVLAWCGHSPQGCIVGFYTYVMCLNTHTSWYHTVLVMMSQRVVPQGWSSTATHCSCLQRAESQTDAYGSDENGQPLNSEQHTAVSLWPEVAILIQTWRSVLVWGRALSLQWCKASPKQLASWDEAYFLSSDWRWVCCFFCCCCWGSRHENV